MRVGIYAGSFDPVHQGHVEFALTAAKQAKLDKVYFLVEPKSRHKAGLTHLAHRLAMLKIATKPQKSLDILELPDRQFSVAKTLPRLNYKFPDDELFLLCGTDVVAHLPDWPLAETMLRRLNLVVGRRGTVTKKDINAIIKRLPTQPKEVAVVDSPRPQLSSGLIRETLLAGKKPAGLEPAVLIYIKTNWLYATPSGSASA